MAEKKEHKPGKMEHKQQQIAPVSIFIMRMLSYAGFAIILIAVSAGVGTVGYMQLADLNLVDSFYMACMILTGMGPTVNMDTNSAKIFSSFYALYSGVVFLGITAVFFAPVIHRLLHILHVENSNDN